MPDAPILAVVFFRTNSGREPVREWLLGLSKEDKKVIGEDIKLVQFRWPLGMPLVRKLEPDLWEIRSRLGAGRIARVFFYSSWESDSAITWLSEEIRKDAFR